jgi:hypothetical protein
MDPFSEVIEILLTVNEKRKDSHFINLARFSSLCDRGRREGKHEAKAKVEAEYKK